jgi:integrase
MFDVYLYEQFLIEKKNLAENTRYLYINTIERFLIESDNLEDIESYNNFIIKYAIKKRSTYIYSVLKSFIEYYITDANKRSSLIEYLIRPDIAQDIKQEREYLDEQDILKIINNMNKEKHKVIALIQDLTGVRAGDVLKLRRGNIVPEIYENKNVLRIIIIGKGKKRNVVYIHDETIQKIIMDFIVQHFLHPDYYFLEQKLRLKTNAYSNKRLHHSNYVAYYRDLKQSMHKLGLNNYIFATHDYRRCYARRVWSKYKDIQVLQELLNHSNPATTMRYLKQSGLKNIDYHKDMQS